MSKDINSYITSAPKEIQAMLLQLREIIQTLAPEAKEAISYGMPGYKLNGKPLMYFAYFKNHVSIFALSGTFFDAYKSELTKYKTSKGTVQFPLDKPLPITLIKKLIKGKMEKIKEMEKVEK